jgi:putative hydrolase of the HAD superfamily
MRGDIEAAAFDLDGTLYPNYRLNLKLIPFVLKEWRLLSAFGKARSIIRKEQESSPAYPVNDFYRHQAIITAGILKAGPDLIEDRINRLIYKDWEQLFKGVKPYAHAVNTLDALRKAGVKTGLLSDFPPEIKLEYLGLSGIWEAVLCTERFGVLKPHKRPFLELAAALSLPPEKILYVGNSHAFDAAGAYHAGMKTALIKNPLVPLRYKQPVPDFTFCDYRQLHEFMLG